jgi:hypothetical protein
MRVGIQPDRTDNAGAVNGASNNKPGSRSFSVANSTPFSCVARPSHQPTPNPAMTPMAPPSNPMMRNLDRNRNNTVSSNSPKYCFFEVFHDNFSFTCIICVLFARMNMSVKNNPAKLIQSFIK